MISIGPLHSPVNTLKVIKTNDKDVAVAGAEVNKDTPNAISQNARKPRGKDRRQRHLKPLIDLRSGRDRRQNAGKPSIDIEV